MGGQANNFAILFLNIYFRNNYILFVVDDRWEVDRSTAGQKYVSSLNRSEITGG